MSVTAPRGFLASGVAAGLKASGRLDLGLLISEQPAAAAGLFTTNAFPAAPVVVAKRRLASGRAQAVVVNSGQANAGTGPEGIDDAEAITAATASVLGLDPGAVVPCSTGVIGPRITTADAVDGVRRAAAKLDHNRGGAFAEAILTTDTATKEAVVEGDGFVVGGCAKGAGMIAPDLATLLVFLTTDAPADPAAVHHALASGARPVWNGVTVDNCPSTNDSVLLLANGAAGSPVHPVELSEAVGEVCRQLAVLVVQDAEGATTTLVVHVDGANTPDDARAAGRAIAGSMLVKTALFGRDPNPGRILQALGASGARMSPGQVTATLAGIPVIVDGRIPPSFDAAACAHAMQDRAVVVRVDLGAGSESATAFGCDLGYDYVRINGEYTT